MLIRLSKLVFVAALIALIGYFVVQANSFSGNSQPSIFPTHLENSTKKIRYTKHFKGGILVLTADSALLKEKSKIVLHGISAEINKNQKKFSIDGETCILDLTERKAFLKDNVNLNAETHDISCNTDSITIDFATGQIFGDSKISGKQAGNYFTSHGVYMDKMGSIRLKRATFRKNPHQ